MKKIVLAALLAYSGVSQAAYECISYDQFTKVKVQKHSTRIGDTLVTIENASGQKKIHGILDEGFADRLLTEKVVNFYDVDGSFTIVSMPKGCGRADCDPLAAPILTGKLVLGDNETFFSCQ